jgi:hypothetical protein
MAATITERVKRKRSIEDSSREYIICDRNPTTHVYNPLDETNALIALLAFAPASIGGFPLIHSKCEVEEVAENIFIGTAHWAFNVQAGSFQISFDISGQTTKVTQSKQTVSKYTKKGYPQHDFQGAINVNEDYSIDGVEIIVPYMSFEVDYSVNPNMIDNAYIATLRDTLGCTNDAPYKGFDTGELLLSKVSGTRRDAENWDLKFGFGVSKNANNLSIGTLPTITKAGWDYLWVWYVKTDMKDSTGAVVGTVKTPANAFVERVYDKASYAALGVPNGLGL